MKNKEEKLDFRVSAFEKESIQQTAKSLNMNTSQFIRFACEFFISWRSKENAELQSSTSTQI